MSLVADYNSESENSTLSEDGNIVTIKTEDLQPDSEEEEKTNFPLDIKETKTAEQILKLPPPHFSKAGSVDNDGCCSSVFLNPFLQAENAKTSILQKHVKMIDSKDAVVINGKCIIAAFSDSHKNHKITGKKICWNYRKGRCRFGHNCKYAHDSDIQKTEHQLDTELQIARAEGIVCKSDGLNTRHTSNNGTTQPVSITETNVSKGNDKKRKRPGLTQGLVPGKKVMKQYMHNKT
ncbi:hypothetical protein ABEB36_014913 [Hypothenemus hampei]|uniref:C3H1-type domain-containing protein n=1 Tax=Hypothenemus hampei TaxID=57062 RepID=A0ABD1E187_HYPHA